MSGKVSESGAAAREGVVQRVMMVSNGLEPPPDEGIKKFASRLASCLGKLLGDRLAVVSIRPTDGVLKRALFADPALLREVRTFRPTAIIYVPTSSASLASLVRSRILALAAPRGCRSALVSLQPPRFKGAGAAVARALAPDVLFSQGGEGSGCLRVRSIGAGVDAGKFRPVSAERKAELRRAYSLPADRAIVLHVGHASRLRGLDTLVAVKEATGAEVLLVCSTTTPADEALVRELESGGVICRRSFVSEIQELYQLADCYLFPTENEYGAIGVPLSVLEAMACNLPVVTTPFGGLPGMFQEGKGLRFVRSTAEIVSGVKEALKERSADTRAKALPFSWDAVAGQILEQMAADRD